MDKYKNRVGEIGINNKGEIMKIVKDNGFKDITVQFKNENGLSNVKTRYNHFKSGYVKNPLFRSIFGKGFIGNGAYKAKINKKATYQYVTWCHMIKRCYDVEYHRKHNTYINCDVATEWHNFQNFAQWYDENYYKINEERMQLDKDILFKNNKLYSPDTCVFVPKAINVLFVNKISKRGEFPIGVSLNKNKFRVQCGNQGENIYLGTFNTINEAFATYKEYKENHIKEVADYYKNQIPEKLYRAMYRYKIEITD